MESDLARRTAWNPTPLLRRGIPHLNETQSLKKDQSSYVSGLLRGAGQKPSGDLWPYVRDLG
jgi:hypothetical protein